MFMPYMKKLNILIVDIFIHINVKTFQFDIFVSLLCTHVLYQHSVYKL